MHSLSNVAVAALSVDPILLLATSLSELELLELGRASILVGDGQVSLGDGEPLPFEVTGSFSGIDSDFFTAATVEISASLAFDSSLGLLTSDWTASLVTVVVTESYLLLNDEPGDTDFLEILVNEFSGLTALESLEYRDELYLCLVLDFSSFSAIFLGFGDVDHASFSIPLSVTSTFSFVAFLLTVSSFNVGILSKESPSLRVLVLDPVLSGGEMGGAGAPPVFVEEISFDVILRGGSSTFSGVSSTSIGETCGGSRGLGFASATCLSVAREDISVDRR